MVVFLFDFLQFVMFYNDSIKYGECFKSELVLMQFIDVFIWIEGNIVQCWFQVVVEDFYKSGFFVIVGVDQVVMVVVVKFDGNVFEQWFIVELYGNVVGN